MAFQGFLKQSTAIDILLGPFLDETNGKDAETGLTIEDEHVRLSKNGENMVPKNEATDAVHDEIGYYNCPLDATDTATVGQLTITCHMAGALPVRLDYHIVEEAVYDAMYGGSAAGPLQSTTAARKLDVNADGEAGLDLDNTSGTLDAAQFGGDFLTAAKIADGAFVAANFAANSLDDKGNWNTVTPDAAGVAPTATEIVDEWETQAALDPTGFKVNVMEVNGTGQTAGDVIVACATATGFATAAHIADIEGTGFAKDTHSLVNIHQLTDTIDGNVSTIVTTTGTILTDTNELQTNQGAWLTATGFATPTNITAGTITTVTNVTNAATNGDLTATMKASVNAEADTAIETYHLDHLLAVNYDPASKPGVGTALLNELIENNAGVSRYTAAALAQGPGGGNVTVGDYTAAALAKFTTVDTGETSAVAGSVAKIAQGAAGGNVTVEDFTQAALAKFADTDTGETTVASGSVSSLSRATWTNASGDDVSTSTATTISVRRGDDWTITIEGMGNISARTKLWFGAKADYDDADSAAIVKVEESIGLQIIAGASPTAAGNATITVDDAAAGDITVTIKAVETLKTSITTNARWDVQWQEADTDGAESVAGGLFKITGDVVRGIG